MPAAIRKRVTCPPKTAVAYARYSSAQQRDVSIEQQLKDIRLFAEREGYTIIYEYADHAKSGFKSALHRAEFQAMLEASSSGSFDTVIAWKVDRFGRNRRESAIYKGQLADNGVSVVYAMEPIPDGAAGVLTEGMLEALAEWYSRTIGENTKRGLYDNASKCLYNGHHAYGYQRSDDNHFVVDEAEAAVVRRIFTLYSQGYSFASISRILSDDGLVTRSGKPFQKSTLLHLLTNESYIGVYHFGPVRIPDGIPPIVDADLWHACQLQREKTSRHHETSPEGYLLSGRCTCGRCGAPMYGNYGTGRNGKRYYFYSCNNKKKNACDSHSIQKKYVEGPLVDFLFDRILSGRTLDGFVDQVSCILSAQQETSPVRQLEKKYRDVLRRIDNINRAISEGIWTESTGALLKSLSAQAEDLRMEISGDRLNNKKEISADRLRFYLLKIADGKRDDYEYLKVLVASLVNSVTIYDHWMRVAINAGENVVRIPPENLPPIDVLPDASRFDFRSAKAPSLYIVKPYPVIVFKIAI